MTVNTEVVVLQLETVVGFGVCVEVNVDVVVWSAVHEYVVVSDDVGTFQTETVPVAV